LISRGESVANADAAVLPYLRLSERKLGYLLNFGAALMKEGITRIIHEEL
jgi:hypothetical protein